jgi:hypothetical protein
MFLSITEEKKYEIYIFECENCPGFVVISKRFHTSIYKLAKQRSSLAV